MEYLSKPAENILKEIIEHRYENGNCDTSYWQKKFESLSQSDDALIRSYFKELREYDAIKVGWADNYPYIIFVLGKGLSYFDEKKREEKRNLMGNSYVNNFYGEANNVQIQQGTVDSTQNITEKGSDVELINQLINTIRKYDSILDDEFGKDADTIRSYSDELETAISTNGDKKVISKIVCYIRDLSVNAGGGLVAAGLVELAKMILG